MHLRPLRLVQRCQLDVACPFGGSKWRQRVELRTAEEDDIHGDIIATISMIHPSSGNP